MPLRSVEAATRDDAIAAAREQFGPQARVVGVRRVRSGGVLGFFATERYVAEVAPDPAGRPPVPGADRAPVDPTATPSPLASAAPARARSTAPARNGAAAYAAVATASPESDAPRAAGDGPSRDEASARSARSAALLRAAEKTADEARLSELARLLGTGTEPPAPISGRATFPRATTIARPFQDLPPSSLVDEFEDDDDPVVEDRNDGPAFPAPSPFTAALARMVSGDRDVRQAVEEALESPASSPSGALAGPWPTWSAPARTAEPSVPSPPARQKEETVGEQVIAPPSMPAGRPAESPTQVAEPEPSREEAIAEVLRSALAQGHSDEALAGILREVLAGASPQTALSEPEPVPPAPDLPNLVADLAEPTVADPDVAPIDELSVDTSTFPAIDPAIDLAALEAVEAPAVEVPAPVVPAVTAVEPPAPVRPAPLPLGPRPMWGEPVSDLWGEPAPLPSAPALTDAPIWAEVVLREPAEKTAVSAPAPVEADAADVDAADVDAEPDEAEEPVGAAETTVPDDAEDVAVEDVAVEDVAVEDAADEESADDESLVELAPLLARTASDPAPMTMSLDATTVMPPLSLLPPLPGMRGRGRPPVPPTLSRPAASSSAPAPVGPGAEPVLDAVRSLATVTRLPIVPLSGAPDLPDVPELDDLADALESLAVDLPVEPEVELGASVTDAAVPVVPAPAPRAPEIAVPARPLPTVGTVPAEPGDVVAQLTALGVPAEVLGAGFASDVAVQGTYAALTRALGLRLPPAPELPMGAGEVLFVVGPGVETLRAARSLAAMLRLDPERVQWATRGDLAGLAPESSRMDTVDAAIDRRQAAAGAGTVTVVAVDAPMRTDAYWMAQMLAIWSPVAVWAVVEATRKPEDLEPWLDSLSRVDALIVQDTDLSADPAAVLRRVAAPVALVDGGRATPHRWASLLCERLEDAQA